MSTICIYHGNCADGFGAAWAVRKALGDDVIFHPGVYGNPPPDVSGAHVVMVDFSYKRPVLEEMARKARTLLILDHHKTAEADLTGMDQWAADNGAPEAVAAVATIFNMDKSGAVLAWEHFHQGKPVPRLLQHIEDRDLWRFAMDYTREIQASVFSRPYDFAVWDRLVEMCEDEQGRIELILEGAAIERKHHKDVEELVAVSARPMVIGGVEVMAANLPYTLASDAAGKLAEDRPFGATYFDTPDGRVFSLRSRGENGADVSAIAKAYGGGGHRNAAGFRMPLGWNGDALPLSQVE